MVWQLITSFIASAGFAVLFNVPKGSLFKCGLVGMFGWVVYLAFTGRGLDAITASLAASFLVTLLSHILAKKYRTPIIVFSVSGIIPLVPGGIAYDAMRNAVENKYDIAVQLAAKAFMISGAIAIGLVFSEVINQIVLRRTRRL